MTETEYIATTNLAKVRLIQQLMRKISTSELPLQNPGCVDHVGYRDIFAILYRWNDDLEKIVKVQP